MISSPYRDVCPGLVSPHRPAAGMMTGLTRVLGLWRERRRQRRALLELSDALLKDVGLTRADAWGEAAKPFWCA